MQLQLQLEKPRDISPRSVWASISSKCSETLTTSSAVGPALKKFYEEREALEKKKSEIRAVLLKSTNLENTEFSEKYSAELNEAIARYELAAYDLNAACSAFGKEMFDKSPIQITPPAGNNNGPIDERSFLVHTYPVSGFAKKALEACATAGELNLELVKMVDLNKQMRNVLIDDVIEEANKETPEPVGEPIIQQDASEEALSKYTDAEKELAAELKTIEKNESKKKYLRSIQPAMWSLLVNYYTAYNKVRTAKGVQKKHSKIEESICRIAKAAKKGLFEAAEKVGMTVASLTKPQAEHVLCGEKQTIVSEKFLDILFNKEMDKWVNRHASGIMAAQAKYCRINAKLEAEERAQPPAQKNSTSDSRTKISSIIDKSSDYAMANEKFYTLRMVLLDNTHWYLFEGEPKTLAGKRMEIQMFANRRSQKNRNGSESDSDFELSDDSESDPESDPYGDNLPARSRKSHQKIENRNSDFELSDDLESDSDGGDQSKGDDFSFYLDPVSFDDE
jgi:hypothetical protein